MHALDPELLSTAKAAREHMLDRQRELERARADLNYEVRRLHAGGGSMREISEQLALSHQRIHQIVSGDATEPDSGIRRLTDRLRALGGSARFGEEARAVVIQARAEAKQAAATAVGPEHLLLALAAPQAGESVSLLAAAGVEHAPLQAALARPPAGPSPRRTPFGAASKKALEAAMHAAQARNEPEIGSASLLRGILSEPHPELDRVLATLRVSREAIEASLDR